ncbi:hypothetical protein ESCO_005824 [Escovopsis weberi]|uniref:Uncharacterized protein n=1 Tax=Escovopsis weberi TaxID=150374 RepID=A0A0M8MYN6_ESCWE|nr:hypothetical protein ESCO_005824 [Escovopsis weberi]
MGIILALAHAWRNRKHPPWALALGTPVLVIAGFLYLLYDCTSKRVKRGLVKKAGDAPITGSPSNSDINTVQVDSGEEDGEIQGEFIGVTIDGGPIIRFNEAAASVTAGLDTQGEVIGIHDGDRPIVAYKKGCIRFVRASQ